MVFVFWHAEIAHRALGGVALARRRIRECRLVRLVTRVEEVIS